MVTDVQAAAPEIVRGQQAAKFEEILTNPASDQRIVAAARAEDRSVRAEGARFTLDSRVLWQAPDYALIDAYVQRLGLPLAAAACVESAGSAVDWAEMVVVRRTHAGDTYPDRRLDPWTREEDVDYLRRLLVLADDPTYRSAVAMLEPFRDGLLTQRILTSYLLPERRGWVAADFAALTPEFRGPRDLLMFSVFDPAQLHGFRGYSLAAFVTVWDAVKGDAVPLLLRALGSGPDTRCSAIDMLSRIPTDTALDGLLKHSEDVDVPAAITAAAARFPRG